MTVFILFTVIISDFICICNNVELLTAGTVVISIFFVSGFQYKVGVYYCSIHLHFTASGQVVWVQSVGLHVFSSVELDARAEYMTEWILTFVANSCFIYSKQEVASSLRG